MHTTLALKNLITQYFAVISFDNVGEPDKLSVETALIKKRLIWLLFLKWHSVQERSAQPKETLVVWIANKHVPPPLFTFKSNHYNL